MISDAYAAGFFDGEGSVYASTRKLTRLVGRSPTMIVCITNTNLPILELHKAKWGGSIAERKVTNPRHQRQWQWVICTKNAKAFLEAILPHVVIKQAQVVLALEYIKLQARPAKEKFDYSNTVRRNGRLWVAPKMRPEHRADVLEAVDAIRACNLRAAPANSRRAFS